MKHFILCAVGLLAVGSVLAQGDTSKPIKFEVEAAAHMAKAANLKGQ